MASIIKKKVKNYTYYYLVESARVNGKPRIVNQKYLGTAKNIARAIDNIGADVIPDPEYSIVFDFGAVCALLDVAERLGVRDIINTHANKRPQGLPVGDSILLASLNRAVQPKSKNSFFSWFDKTILHNQFPAANKKNLSSQGFWNNMSVLNDNKLRNIEDELTKIIVEKYDLSTECLLFDNTNFITYLDTANSSELAKRGNSKQKRSDLKIIGLSLMASPENNIPLFHETYPGNTNDAKRFSEVIESLKSRYKKIQKGNEPITLVFDKGNNNESNIEDLLNKEPCEFHFVGGLRLSQCPELLDIPKEEFAPLEGECFKGTIGYRTRNRLYNKETTVVLTFNPTLFEAQLEGIWGNIFKCIAKLQELQLNLKARIDGTVTKGKKPTVNSVTDKISGILSAQHMKEIFDYCVSLSEQGVPIVSFSMNEQKLENLKEKVLGKSLIFTDHTDWANEKIVSTYRALYHIEDCFKQMKDIRHLGFRPVHHWTDRMIRVHAFYCVLALTLCSVLNSELEIKGYKMSINSMLDMLMCVQQVITVFPQSEKKHII